MRILEHELNYVNNYMKNTKHSIVPHLWFDKEAVKAAEFYCSIFPNSKIINKTILQDTPSGNVDSVIFELSDEKFMAISAGPIFKTNPSISFMINFDPSKIDNAKEDLDKLWGKLSDGGEILMPIDKYPFSERYGWIQDKFGISWQLILANPDGEERPFIIPSLLFITDSCEIAEEATDFYLSVFKDTKRGEIARYPTGMEPNKKGAIMYTDFQIEGKWFTAMDSSSQIHDFKFNEAISFIIYCDSQEDIDYYWKNLSAVPESEQCGWLKDKYGISWQVVPRIMDEMMQNGTEEQIARVTQEFLKMKKFNIKKLEKAFKG